MGRPDLHVRGRRQVQTDHRRTRPNADLYQLLAYATALALPGGLLIYAQGEAEPAAYRVRHAEKRLEIAALDPSGTIDDLLARIGALAQRIRSMRARNPHESGRLIRSTVPAAACPMAGSAVSR